MEHLAIRTFNIGIFDDLDWGIRIPNDMILRGDRGYVCNRWLLCQPSGDGLCIVRHGICLIIAGATLITPGFLTDFIGFVLLFPPARNMIRYLIRTRTSWGVEGFASTPHEHTRNTPAPGEIIEGDYERVDDK